MAIDRKTVGIYKAREGGARATRVGIWRQRGRVVSASDSQSAVPGSSLARADCARRISANLEAEDSSDNESDAVEGN